MVEPELRDVPVLSLREVRGVDTTSSVLFELPGTPFEDMVRDSAS
jgi:hypothetical protein